MILTCPKCGKSVDMLVKCIVTCKCGRVMVEEPTHAINRPHSNK